ncbi:MAG: hypothetical protein ACR2H0_02365 [Candidatus Limnocylindrales bacterium]
MTTVDRFGSLLTDWLEDQPTRAPDQLLETVITDLHRTPQRARWQVAFRRIPMLGSNQMRLYLAVGAVGLAAVIGFGLWAGRPDVSPGATPSPSPTALPSPTLAPTASPSPAPVPTPSSTATWTTDTSSQYGFTTRHPADWNVDPADRAWVMGTDAGDPLSPAMDDFTAPDGHVRVSAWSVPLDPGTVVDETYEEVQGWISDYCQVRGSPTCNGTLDAAVHLCVEVRDCHPGLLLVSEQWEVQAFFCCGIYSDQMLVVTIWWGDGDPALARYGGGRRLIEAFLSPMCVWPEDARPEPPPSCTGR